jgi:hypothetical protein
MRICERRTLEVEGIHSCLVHLLHKDTDRIFMSRDKLGVCSVLSQLLRVWC